MLRFIKKFTDKEIDFVKLDNKYFLKNSKLIELNEELGYKPEVLGLLLGEDKDGKFFPSLALLEILSKVSKERIILKGFGEIDFVYGKDLKKRHINRIEGETKVGFLKLIQNAKGENIGYGKIIKDLESSSVVIKNKLDRGDFLRREKK